MNTLRRPRLVPGTRFVEQRLQGELGYVVKSPANGKYLRFREAEARVIQLFDGHRTVLEIASQLAASGVQLAASSIDAFATKLATFGLVERTFEEKTSVQLERLRLERRERRKQPLFRGELLRMRFPMSNPDRWLTKTLPYLRWCFTPAFVWVSLVIFAGYAALLTARWSELSDAFSALLSPASLTIGTGLLFWGSFVFVGAVHELGHAYACKAFSGEVNEMGFMVMYFQPAFYCNVNDAWSFTQLRHRLWVTAAGAWIELLLGAAAATVWALVTPGSVVATIALFVTVLAGGLALLSNANPLLPLDGYFALSDWLEIPNLRQRALQYVRWFTSTRLLRRQLEEPVVTERERRIFLVYGGLATAYIATVYLVVLRVGFGWASRAFGVAWAVAIFAGLVLWQRRRILGWYFAARDVTRELTRSRRVSVLRRLPAVLRGRWGIVLAVALVLLIPWPRSANGYWTALPTGLVVVTAPTDGIVTAVSVQTGEHISAGAPVISLRDVQLERALYAQSSVRDSLQLRSRASVARRNDQAETEAAFARAAESRTSELTAGQRALTVRATMDGDVLTNEPQLLLGKNVRAGQALLQIGRSDSIEIRVRLSGAGAASVRAGDRVSLLLDADAGRPIVTTIATVSPVSSTTISGATEASVWLASTPTWRAGTSGAARVRLAMSTVGGALVWAVRSRLRPDLLL